MSSDGKPGVRLALTLSGADVGERVVVRYALPEGGFSDLLGELVTWDADAVTVATKTGPVTVPAADVRAGKRIPPPPAPRLRRPS